MVSRPRGKRRGLNRAGDGLGWGSMLRFVVFFPLASPGATESRAGFGTLLQNPSLRRGAPRRAWYRSQLLVKVPSGGPARGQVRGYRTLGARATARS